MGISNLRLGLENLHATLRGDLRANETELKSLEIATERMKDLFHACDDLRRVIAAVEQVLRHDNPDWQPTLVAPRPKRKWTSLFKPGDRGRIALTILRENGR